ncbi:hypothetical protein D3C83_173360 [compost metagenome]
MQYSQPFAQRSAGSTATWSPTANVVTPSPISATSPENSCPSRIGAAIGNEPS